MLAKWLVSMVLGVAVVVPVKGGPGPAGPGVAACKTWCVWDAPHFGGNLVELAGSACKDYPIKSAANNADDPRTAIFFFRQPGCQGPPVNRYGLKARHGSAHVTAASAQLKAPTG